MVGPGNPPISTAIARDPRHPTAAGWRGAQPCTAAAAMGNETQATAYRVYHLGKSHQHHPVLGHGAGANRWHLQP